MPESGVSRGAGAGARPFHGAEAVVVPIGHLVVLQPPVRGCQHGTCAMQYMTRWENCEDQSSGRMNACLCSRKSTVSAVSALITAPPLGSPPFLTTPTPAFSVPPSLLPAPEHLHPQGEGAQGAQVRHHQADGGARRLQRGGGRQGGAPRRRRRARRRGRHRLSSCSAAEAVGRVLWGGLGRGCDAPRPRPLRCARSGAARCDVVRRAVAELCNAAASGGKSAVACMRHQQQQQLCSLGMWGRKCGAAAGVPKGCSSAPGGSCAAGRG